MPSFAARNRRPEIMDQPDLDAARFIGSLAGLRRVNLVTGSSRILWPHIRAWAQTHHKRPIRILDIACGAGDMLVRLDRRSRREGIFLELHGCDIKSLAIDYAREQTKSAGASAEFFTLDATRDPIPPEFDMIVSSLFLHHLDEEQAVKFLRNASSATNGLLLIHDLVRSQAGYLLASLGIRALLCNDVCRADGPISVESAFTLHEARELAAKAGLEGATVEPRFPFRLLMHWEKS